MQTLPPLPEWVSLEHQVAQILTKQEQHGWYFNEPAARELESTLRKEYEETSKLLRNRYPYVSGSVFTPKRDNRTKGYVANAPFTKLKELNPVSMDHIAWILTTHYDWQPSSLTNSGKAVRRDRIERHWDGYCSTVSDTTGSDQKAWDDIRRRERMAEACYEI